MTNDEYLKKSMDKDLKKIFNQQQDPEYQEKKRIEQLRKDKLNNELLDF